MAAERSRDPGVVYAHLKANERARADEVTRLSGLVAGLTSRVQEHRANLDWAVVRALDDGVPASVLASLLGVSESRVYQIRVHTRKRAAASILR